MWPTIIELKSENEKFSCIGTIIVLRIIQRSSELYHFIYSFLLFFLLIETVHLLIMCTLCVHTLPVMIENACSSSLMKLNSLSKTCFFI